MKMTTLEDVLFLVETLFMTHVVIDSNPDPNGLHTNWEERNKESLIKEETEGERSS